MPLKILLNEETKSLPDETTVARLLMEFAGKTKGVAVVVNDGIVPKTDYETTVLGDGDQVEILTFAGGG